MSGIYAHLVPEDLDPVPVHVYTHPDWDMKLILLAEEGSRYQALQNLGAPYICRGDCLSHDEPSRHNNPADLVVSVTTMPREEFVNLTEFDG